MDAENPKGHQGCLTKNAASADPMVVWPGYFPQEPHLPSDDPRVRLVGDLVKVLELEERGKLLPRVSTGLRLPCSASFPSPLAAMRFCF
jgi:hypothetical protein